MWFSHGALKSLPVRESELPNLYCIYPYSAGAAEVLLVSWLRKWSVQCLYDFHHSAQEDDVRTTKPFLLSTFTCIFVNFLIVFSLSVFFFLACLPPSLAHIYSVVYIIILYLLKNYNSGWYCVKNISKPQTLHYLLLSSFLDVDFCCLKVLPWLKPWRKTAATFAGCYS